MKIDDNLNIVLPLVEGTPDIDAFHSPIDRPVFEANYRLLAATRAALGSKGSHYQLITGPQIAAMTLREEGRKDAVENGDPKGDGGAAAFIAELKRRTLVLCPSESGWERLPVDTAISRDMIDAEDWEDGLSHLVFFTCHWWLAKKSERPTIREAMGDLLGMSFTSSNATAYCDSSPTSTSAGATTGKTSSVPT